MKIDNLWEKLSQPNDKLETFKKDVAEGKVPELPYYIVGQNKLKKEVKKKIEQIDSGRMSTNLIVANYGNGKTNLLKYLQLFFNECNKGYGIKIHYTRADIERTDIILFLLKIIQNNYLENLISIIKSTRDNPQLISSFVNNFSNNFSEIKEYTESLFDKDNDDEKITQLIYLGTGRLANKRYFDKHDLEQLKDFNRREILVLFLNLLAHKKTFLIFAIDEIEKIREKSKIRFNHFLTSYRELVDLFNQINGHYLITAMTDGIGSTQISEANDALYTRIKNDIIDIDSLNKPQDRKELIKYLDNLFGTNQDIEKTFSQIRKQESGNNRTLIQNISNILNSQKTDKTLNELLKEFNLSTLYQDTKTNLDKDEAFKNIHRKFFDPLEYYNESIGIPSETLNKQKRVFIDNSTYKLHYFIFHDYVEDLENEKSKILNLIDEEPEKELIIYSPEKLGLTNSFLNISEKVEIVDYNPEELFVLLEMYRKNFESQEDLGKIISAYTKQNL
ncbi:DUF2791 family P-loop domain-containing protein [Tenacibaculum mesophilum]|uniref:BREX system ATP-binding domain-containing protein n=1 Tax=Tenacibaculum mesophilum TaxID=104268 RepID=UPI001430A658|nr:BREX system ATP-binding domain-containing protein [Tenacibaculum mesophilum]KAF9659993.1 DUF2791 family P-loop domain-containing protein [Tenacibaculum mesophilum]